MGPASQVIAGTHHGTTDHVQQQQQQQQHWLHAEGLQNRVDDLAAYVDFMATAEAKAAQELHSTTWRDKQRLEGLVQQQAAQLHQQTAELEVLRGLQCSQQQQQHSGSDMLQVGAKLQQHMEFQKAARKACDSDPAAAPAACRAGTPSRMSHIHIVQHTAMLSKLIYKVMGCRVLLIAQPN